MIATLIINSYSLFFKIYSWESDYPSFKYLGISETKDLLEKLMEPFVAETTARTAAELVGVNRNTSTKFFCKFREIIASNVEDSSLLEGEIEVEESYFGGKRKAKEEEEAQRAKFPFLGC